MLKRIVSTILLIIWMLIIFMFSNDNGVTSAKKSDKFAGNVIDTVSDITKQKVTSKERNNLIKKTSFIVRKTAHFTLYFILGILIYVTLSSYSIDRRIVMYSILFAFTYSISDEIHQLFSDGRAFKILDILIDTIASTLSISLINLFKIKRMS